MAEGRIIPHVDEAIVLRTWPFQEADLLVSLFTRQGGRIKGIARYGMRSRRRFGGALEPMSVVRANYAERPRQELMRLDAFEIVASPLSAAIDWERTAGLQLMAEVLEETLPEQAVDDAVFRLAVAVLAEMRVRKVILPAAYFCLWMARLMGWMPALGHCAVCGLELGTVNGGAVWWSPARDGVVCADDRGSLESVRISPEAVLAARAIFRSGIADAVAEPMGRGCARELLRFGVGLLERSLGRRLRSAAVLGRELP